MNPLLKKLQPYPFERLRALLAGAVPDKTFAPINLSIGEPKHATPSVVTDAIAANFAGLSGYPATAGLPTLRQAMVNWLERRYALKGLDPNRHVLPVLGSREALFALTQVVVDASQSGLAPAGQAPIVIAPNPFYQIYEGATLLAGAQPYYVNQSVDADFACDWAAVPAQVWAKTQLVFVCSPGNPTGRVMPLSEWQYLFELSDRYGFVIAADECYSEIWHSTPPLGALEAAQTLNRDFTRLISFTSLSKRSNTPGMRSGFVSGDPQLIAAFLLYRTYHGSAMSPMIQAASEAAWNDETHVQSNRALYAEKFKAVGAILQSAFPVRQPDAGFYFWLDVRDVLTKMGMVGLQDDQLVRRWHREINVLTLPGSYLSRPTETGDPGAGFIRIALVEPLDACIAGAVRMVEHVIKHSKQHKSLPLN